MPDDKQQGEDRVVFDPERARPLNEDSEVEGHVSEQGEERFRYGAERVAARDEEPEVEGHRLAFGTPGAAEAERMSGIRPEDDADPADGRVRF